MTSPSLVLHHARRSHTSALDVSRATTSPLLGFFSSGGAPECSTTLSARLVEAHRSRDGRHRRFHPRHRPRVRRRQAPRRAPRAQPWCASHPASADETTNASVRWPQKSLWIGPARARRRRRRARRFPPEASRESPRARLLPTARPSRRLAPPRAPHPTTSLTRPPPHSDPLLFLPQWWPPAPAPRAA